MILIEHHFEDKKIIKSYNLAIEFEDAVSVEENIFLQSGAVKMFLKDTFSDRLLKIELVGNQTIKSFVLDLFNFEENFYK
jgi:hypothetical protein